MYIFSFTIIKFFFGFLVWRWFFECGVSWSLEVSSDGDLLWLFSCRWSGIRPESQGYGDGGGRCVKPVWCGDVELHEGRYWSVSLCAGVGGSGGGGVNVDGAASVGSGKGYWQCCWRWLWRQ